MDLLLLKTAKAFPRSHSLLQIAYLDRFLCRSLLSLERVHDRVNVVVVRILDAADRDAIVDT